MSQENLSEWLPKKGQVYQEDMPNVVLCKPKILPLKSVTLEKMEKMQKEAQDQVREQEKQARLKTDQ
uniref:BBSome-interacting protein 1 n=1 Tax=Arion vulgaris TaxID=1028688 RepID=A0A0B6ZP27_9EUPU